MGPGVWMVDGASVTANLGVNPSLTITAQAERAMSMWPNKGSVDPRPIQGSKYESVEFQKPMRAFVPEHAVGALKVFL